jgi:hypothetical protein
VRFLCLFYFILLFVFCCLLVLFLGLSACCFGAFPWLACWMFVVNSMALLVPLVNIFSLPLSKIKIKIYSVYRGVITLLHSRI